MPLYRLLILDDGGQTIGIQSTEFDDDSAARAYADELLTDGGCARVEVWRGEQRIHFADIKARNRS